MAKASAKPLWGPSRPRTARAAAWWIRVSAADGTSGRRRVGAMQMRCGSTPSNRVSRAVHCEFTQPPGRADPGPIRRQRSASAANDGSSITSGITSCSICTHGTAQRRGGLSAGLTDVDRIGRAPARRCRTGAAVRASCGRGPGREALRAIDRTRTPSGSVTPGGASAVTSSAGSAASNGQHAAQVGADTAGFADASAEMPCVHQHPHRSSAGRRARRRSARRPARHHGATLPIVDFAQTTMHCGSGGVWKHGPQGRASPGVRPGNRDPMERAVREQLQGRECGPIVVPRALPARRLRPTSGTDKCGTRWITEVVAEVCRESGLSNWSTPDKRRPLPMAPWSPGPSATASTSCRSPTPTQAFFRRSGRCAASTWCATRVTSACRPTTRTGIARHEAVAPARIDASLVRRSRRGRRTGL